MPSPREATANPKAETLAGLIALCVWFALFIAGFSVDSKPYRDTLASEAGGGEKILAFVIVIFCYTITNGAMLCCAASVMGSIFRRMRARHRPLSPSLPVLLISSVFQGFVVYLVMTLGILSFAVGEPHLGHPKHHQYVQMALTSSLISLMIGYSPGLFNSLMGQLEKWAAQGIPNRGAEPSMKPSHEVAESVGASPSEK